MTMQVKDYQSVEFESSCMRTPEYRSFERQCKKELIQMCREFGIHVQEFKPGHFEWSAVLEKDGKFVYVSLSDVRYWDWYNIVLIRTMADETDWHGVTNNMCHFDKIGETAERLFNHIN